MWGRAAGSAAGWLGGWWYEGGAIKVHGSWRPRQVRAVDSRLRRHTRSCDNLYRARVSPLAGRGAPTPPSTRQFDGVVDPQTRDGTRAASLELADESQRSGMMTRCAHATTRPPTARVHKRTRYRERAASLTYRVTRALVELAKIAPTRAQTNRRAYHHAAPSAYARARSKKKRQSKQKKNDNQTKKKNDNQNKKKRQSKQKKITTIKPKKKRQSKKTKKKTTNKQNKNKQR